MAGGAGGAGGAVNEMLSWEVLVIVRGGRLNAPCGFCRSAAGDLG